MSSLSSQHAFSAKILLFGEYTLLVGSKALAMPLPIFKGTFKQKKEASTHDDINSNIQLLEFAKYLSTDERFPFIDTAQFINDCKEGIYFKSNIPQGYGVGSSGAVAAAVYQRYRKTKSSDLAIQKKELALMESYFHGESSGIDPLVIFHNKPLIINTLSNISIIDKEINLAKMGVELFLVDTKTTASTAPLVKSFKQAILKNEFKTIISEQVTPLVDAIIENILTQSTNKQLLKKIKKLSELQLKHFATQIPAHIKPLWEEGLRSDEFYLKLCGSGGGGYLLGFKKSSY